MLNPRVIVIVRRLAKSRPERRLVQCKRRPPLRHFDDGYSQLLKLGVQQRRKLTNV
jgi:hypothetical protein